MDFCECLQLHENLRTKELRSDAYVKTVVALAVDKPISAQSTNKNQIATTGNGKLMTLNLMTSAGKDTRANITDGKRGKTCNLWRTRER